MKFKNFVLYITAALVIMLLFWEVYRFFRTTDHFNYLYQAVGTTKHENSFSNKTIVMFGDSIYAPITEGGTVPQMVQSMTGAHVYGVAFGGCRMSSGSQYWDAFSMYNLTDAIISKKFNLQDKAIIAMSSDKNSGMPGYYESALNTLKSIDFNKVDYITISYGTNDYTAGKILDNNNNSEDKDTFAGAMRYSLRTIMSTYPQIKILILTPTYRFWNDDGNISDSDTRYFNSQKNTLIDFVEETKKVGKDFKVPVLDMYSELGINRYNMHYYLADGTHHTERGKNRIAERIAAFLKIQ